MGRRALKISGIDINEETACYCDILTAKQVSGCADADKKSLRFPISSLDLLEKKLFFRCQLAAEDPPDFSV